MSLFVIGLDVPKSCYDCVQNDKDDNCFYFLSNCQVWIEEICKGNIDCEDLPKDHRDITCPLSEIPTPHGRLIDADKLTKNMRNYYPSIDHLCCSQHVVTKGDIDNAPTVIEAEHESEARKWARVGRDISKGLQEGIEAINSEVPE